MISYQSKGIHGKCVDENIEEPIDGEDSRGIDGLGMLHHHKRPSQDLQDVED